MTAALDATTAATGEAKTTSSWAVMAAITRRGVQRVLRVPTVMIPAVIMPIFFLVSFSGTFSAVTEVGGYGTDKAVNWFAAYSVVMGASFAGTGAAGAAATDLENGFFDRLRLAPVNPAAIVAGLLSYSIVRATVPTTFVLLAAALMGASFTGGPLGLLLVYVATWGVAATIGCLGLAVVFRLKSLQSLAIIQIFIFTFTFTSVGQAPLVAIEGWLHGVASYNPMTFILRMTRQLFLGEVTWSATWQGLVALAGVGGFAALLALSQLRSIQD